MLTRTLIKLACILFISSACTSVKKEKKWNFQFLETPSVISKRIFTPYENTFADETNIEFEIILNPHHVRSYLNLLDGFTRPGLSDNECECIIQVNNNPAQKIYLKRHLGGQHLLLPESTTRFIISELKNNNIIQLTVENRYITLYPSNFNEALNYCPSFINYPQWLNTP